MERTGATSDADEVAQYSVSGLPPAVEAFAIEERLHDDVSRLVQQDRDPPAVAHPPLSAVVDIGVIDPNVAAALQMPPQGCLEFLAEMAIRPPQQQ